MVPGIDIVNRNAQFLIGLEKSIRTAEMLIRLCSIILSTWMANSYGMAMEFLPDERKRNITTASSVRDVILRGLFPAYSPVIDNRNIDASTRSMTSMIHSGGSSPIVSASVRMMLPLKEPVTIPTVVVGQEL